MFVVFDLDGTLALCDHREHFIRGETKDWDAFFAACVDDQPNWPIINTYNALATAGHRVVIWTGRSAVVADQTLAWLMAHGVGVGSDVGYGEMVMRLEDDRSPDRELKRKFMEEDSRPDLVFEDRQSMVDWWREQGIVCVQVAPGRF